MDCENHLHPIVCMCLDLFIGQKQGRRRTNNLFLARCVFWGTIFDMAPQKTNLANSTKNQRYFVAVRECSYRRNYKNSLVNC